MDAGSVGVFIPIVAIIAWGAVKVATIQARTRGMGPDPQIAGRLDAVENELGTVRHELAETQERLDFAERLLAQHRTDRLDAPQ